MDEITLRRCSLLLLVVFTSLNLAAQAPAPTEYEVKAAYLLNFIKFIQWPAVSPRAATDSIDICLLGRDPFGPVLDKLVAGQEIDGKKVFVRRVAAASEAGGCRVLFMGSSQKTQLNKTLATLGDTPVLTVSDMTEFASHGGIIQFVLQDNRVRFEINLANAERVGLNLSARLLNVATSVRRN